MQVLFNSILSQLIDKLKHFLVMYTKIQRQEQGCLKQSSIVHYFLLLVFQYIFGNFFSFKQKSRTLKYKSCELSFSKFQLFGKYSNFLENIPTFWKIFQLLGKYSNFQEKIPTFWKNFQLFGKISNFLEKKSSFLEKISSFLE